MRQATDTVLAPRPLVALVTLAALVSLSWALPAPAPGAPATEEYNLNLPGNDGNDGNDGTGDPGAGPVYAPPPTTAPVPADADGTADGTARPDRSVDDAYDPEAEADARRLSAADPVVPVFPLVYKPDGGLASDLPLALLALLATLAAITGGGAWAAYRKRRADST